MQWLTGRRLWAFVGLTCSQKLNNKLTNINSHRKYQSWSCKITISFIQCFYRTFLHMYLCAIIPIHYSLSPWPRFTRLSVTFSTLSVADCWSPKPTITCQQQRCKLIQRRPKRILWPLIYRPRPAVVTNIEYRLPVRDDIFAVLWFLQRLTRTDNTYWSRLQLMVPTPAIPTTSNQKYAQGTRADTMTS